LQRVAPAVFERYRQLSQDGARDAGNLCLMITIAAPDDRLVGWRGENVHEGEVGRATANECRQALEKLTGRLSDMDAKTRQAKLADRTLSCRVTDLGVTYLTRLGPHGADPISEAHDGSPAAQIRFTAKSDDVLAIADDPGSFAKAWLSGRLKVEGNFFDLLNLRKML
jgi:hypothetical protein